MSAEDQLRKLKQIPPLTKEEKRGKLMTAIVLSLATLISVLFLVYAFVQKMEADRNAELATKLSEKLAAQAQECQKEAEVLRRVAEAAKQEADQHRLLSVQALEACQNSKK